MKNELQPWEVGIAAQMKTKEFSFDPQAFADFENLLEAETLGKEPGHQAPDSAGEVMSVGGSTISFPIILLVIGLAGLASWWYLAGEPEILEEPAVTISVPPPAPSREVAPAAPPSISASTITQTLSETYELDAALPDLSITPTNFLEPIEIEGEVANLEEVNEEETPNPPRILRATARLATLSIQPVAQLEAATISVPTVQKPIPTSIKRDRKALFPDVIKKN